MGIFTKLTEDENTLFLLPNGKQTFTDGVIIGNPGTEGDGVNIGGVTYESTFKVSDINGTNYAQTILHRHSTTLEPLIVGARSNSNDNTHANITSSQNVFSIYGTGWAGSNYKIFGQISIGADSTGTISNTSAPGRIEFKVTPDGSITPATVMFIKNNGNIGIGTTSPACKLDTVGTIRTTGISSPASGAGFEMQYTGVTGGLFSYNRTTSTWGLINLNDILHCKENQYVGIGTTSPTCKLDVTGTIRSTTTVAPVSGTGLELNYYSGTSQGEIFAYNRTTSDWQNLSINNIIYCKQNTQVGIGILSGLNASAILQLSSTTKGFLPPVMITTDKNAIASPATGLVVFDTTLDALCVKKSTGWTTITSV